MARSPKTPPPTYAVTGDRKSILCLRCGRRSHNENDVRHLYCGACGYHPIARRIAVEDPQALVVALIARAIYAGENQRSVRTDAVGKLKEAMALIEADMVIASLSDMAGGE